MNKKMKIIFTIMLTVVLLSIVTSVFAAGEALDPSEFEPDYSSGKTEDIMTITNKIMGLIRNVSVIIGVIILMVIGVKFMLGSAEEKAEYKKSLMPLVVGIVIVMAATSIMSLIFSILG